MSEGTGDPDGDTRKTTPLSLLSGSTSARITPPPPDPQLSAHPQPQFFPGQPSESSGYQPQVFPGQLVEEAGYRTGQQVVAYTSAPGPVQQSGDYASGAATSQQGHPAPWPVSRASVFPIPVLLHAAGAPAQSHFPHSLQAQADSSQRPVRQYAFQQHPRQHPIEAQQTVTRFGFPQHLQQSYPHLQPHQPAYFTHYQTPVPVTSLQQTAPTVGPPASSYRQFSQSVQPHPTLYEQSLTPPGSQYATAGEQVGFQPMEHSCVTPPTPGPHFDPGAEFVPRYPPYPPYHMQTEGAYSTHQGGRSDQFGAQYASREESSSFLPAASMEPEYFAEEQPQQVSPSADALTSQLSPLSKAFEPRQLQLQQQQHPQRYQQQQHQQYQQQQQQQRQQQHRRHSAQKRPRVDHHQQASPTPARPPPDVLRQLEDYGERVLRHLQGPLCVPAVTFNEQKFESRAGQGYCVLREPQTPAIRGQEALSRVCHSVEQILRERGEPAIIITDYKFKECYLRRAPGPDPWKRPAKEGSHNILVFGPNIGVIFIQVTCMDSGTNPGTMKKQTREKLKQLEKDEEVFKQLMADLGLPEGAILKVMALPNISMETLEKQLEPRTFKKLSAILGPKEDPNSQDGLLTSDLFPEIGHRHWQGQERHSKLAGRIDDLIRKAHKLSMETFLQIGARYTCGWSATEVWTMKRDPITEEENHRREIRTPAHAIAETVHRHRAPVLTPEMDQLLQENRDHVIVTGEPGCGSTFMMLVKVRLALMQGWHVVLLLPPGLRGLRRYYESELKEHRERVFFLEGGAANTSLDGTSATLDDIRSRAGRKLAVCDNASEDNDLVKLVVREAPTIFQSIWVASDRPLDVASSSVTFHEVRLTRIIRLPTSVQALLRHGLSGGTFSAATSEPSTASSRTSAAQFYCEESSHCFLPTDGLDPLIIWHPRSGTGAHSDVLHCGTCQQRLDAAFEELAAVLSVGRRGAEGPGGDSGIGENSGRVPPPLPLDDFVVFTDYDPHMRNVLADKLARLDILPQEKQQRITDECVRRIEDLPAFKGTEKAVVVYVGRLEAPRNGILRALTSKLRDVMSLCQGRLVLALDVDVLDHDPGELRRPYQLEMELALQEAEKRHGLTG